MTTTTTTSETRRPQERHVSLDPRFEDLSRNPYAGSEFFDRSIDEIFDALNELRLDFRDGKINAGDYRTKLVEERDKQFSLLVDEILAAHGLSATLPDGSVNPQLPSVQEFARDLIQPLFERFTSRDEPHWFGENGLRQQYRGAAEVRREHLGLNRTTPPRLPDLVDSLVELQGNNEEDSRDAKLAKRRRKLAKKIVKKSHGATGLSGFGLRGAARRYDRLARDVGESEYQELHELIGQGMAEHHDWKLWLGERLERRRRLKHEGVAGVLGNVALGASLSVLRQTTSAIVPGGHIAVAGAYMAGQSIGNYARRSVERHEDVVTNFLIRQPPEGPRTNYYVKSLKEKAKRERKDNSREALKATFSWRNIGRAVLMAAGYFGSELVDGTNLDTRPEAMRERALEWANTAGDRFNDVVGGSVDFSLDVIDGKVDLPNALDHMPNLEGMKEQVGEITHSAKEKVSNIDMPWSGDTPDTSGDHSAADKPDTDTGKDTETQDKSVPGEETPAEYDKKVVIKPGDGLTNIVNRMTEGGPGSARPMIDQAMEMGLGDVTFPDGSPLIEMVNGEPQLTQPGVMPEKAVAILAKAADAKGYDLAA